MIKKGTIENFKKAYDELIERKIKFLRIEKLGAEYLLDIECYDDDIIITPDTEKELQAINSLFEFIKYYSLDKIIHFDYYYKPQENRFICNYTYNTDSVSLAKEENNNCILESLNKVNFMLDNSNLKEKTICIKYQSKNNTKNIKKSFKDLLTLLIDSFKGE